jgi:hypothetical protein
MDTQTGSRARIWALHLSCGVLVEAAEKALCDRSSSIFRTLRSPCQLCYAAPNRISLERSRPMAVPTSASIVAHFQTIEDPRIERTKKHNLLDILAR